MLEFGAFPAFPLGCLPARYYGLRPLHWRAGGVLGFLAVGRPAPMTAERTNEGGSVYASIGIFAWNEERAIAAALDSLFEQSLFGELRQRRASCEVICVVNGCTDRTPLVAAEIFKTQARQHPEAKGFSLRVVELAERGKVNAWNQF